MESVIEKKGIFANLQMKLIDYVNSLSLKKAVLLFSLFASGACGLVLEHIQGTVAVFILGGNPVQIYIVVYSVMMFAMGMGSRKQVKIPKKNLLLSFIGVEISLAVIGGFSPIFLMWVNGLFEGSFYVFFGIIIYSIGYLIGLEIPIITRINEDYSKELSVNVGQVLQADYFGSLAGGLLFATYLIKFPLTESPFILGIVNLGIAISAFLVFKRCEKEVKMTIKYTKTIVTISFIVFLSLSYGLSFNRVWASNLEQRLYPNKILGAWQNSFQRILFFAKKNNGHVSYELKINGNSQFDSVDEPKYHESFVLPALELKRASLTPLNILILGGGDGMVVREILKYQKMYNNIGKILLVDLDPMMTKLFKGELSTDEKLNKLLCSLNDNALKNAKVVVLPGAGVTEGGLDELYLHNGRWDSPGVYQEEKITDLKIINIDADKFLNSVSENSNLKWDLVFSDFPDPSSVGLSKLYSREFYLKLKKMLKPRGLMVVQSTSPDKAKETYQCIGRTIKSAGFNVLPYNEYVPTWSGLWGWWMAWGEGFSRNTILREIENMEFEVPTKFLTGDVFRKQLVFGKDVRTGKPYFESARFDAVTTNSNPVIHDYYQNHGTW